MMSAAKVACSQPCFAGRCNRTGHRTLLERQPCRSPTRRTFSRGEKQQLRAVSFDSDTLLGVVAGALGLGLGLGIPLFLVARDERDDERVQEIQQLNRATRDETGEFMSETEIESMRPRRWTDRRDFQDDD